MTSRNRTGIASWALSLVFSLSLSPAALASGGGTDEHGNRTSRISDTSSADIDESAFPGRPRPIIELGTPFLGPGNVERGFELPTGAVWQPALIVFGTYRTAVQSFHANDETYSEWANRMDLYANLQLSGSERILLGIRPLDQDGKFTSYQFEPDAPAGETGWNSEVQGRVTTLFFEGDFGEIFPGLDRDDNKGLDIGFSIGRQPLNYQAGILVNDSIDAIGLTRNTLKMPGGSDLQATFLFGWDEVHRNDNTEYPDTKLYSLNFAADLPSTTINADFVYVQDRKGDTDGFFWGISDIRRIGHYNLSTRVLGSHATEVESPTVRDGNLIFAELSWTPAWTVDHVYVNAFLGIDQFSSAARDPSAGGPLGQTGILFQAIGMGRYGAPLGNRADDAFGGAVGYQWFIDPIKNQFIFEIGGRSSTRSDVDASAVAAGVRYRHVLGQHIVAQFDVFGAWNENRSNSYGTRVEMRVEF
ncbi:MAG: hypothetical protein KDI19_06130 [Pseudomonadales bacterium]|nr:hypothetical protein [Pseudomonadales bacterium]